MKKQGVGKQGFISCLFTANPYSLAFLFLIWGAYILFYYFGEIVDFFGWTTLRWDIFYSVHDAHRAAFLIPIIYAAYVFGVRATLIICVITTMAFLPRALFVSPYPDPVFRMLVFMLIATGLGHLTAIARREAKKGAYLQATLRKQRDRLLNILERMEDGVLIVGPDHRIRYMNPSMIRDFGDNIGAFCYKSLYKLNEPCKDICRLPDVLKGSTAKGEYIFPDGRAYEVQASPFTDADGANCQLTIYRNLANRNKPLVMEAQNNSSSR